MSWAVDGTETPASLKG